MNKFSILLTILICFWPIPTVLAEGKSVSVPQFRIPDSQDPYIVEKICGAKGFCTSNEARAASARHIVLHYGEDMVGHVDAHFGLMDHKGYPAIALPGGPDGHVKLYVAELSPKELFTSEDIHMMRLLRTAEKIYYAKIKPLLILESDSSQPIDYCVDKDSCRSLEAQAASVRQIVLHYGEGMEIDARAQVRLFNQDPKGYPAIALPGGWFDDRVKLYVAQESPKKLYTPKDLHMMILNNTAEKLYDAKIRPLLASPD